MRFLFLVVVFSISALRIQAELQIPTVFPVISILAPESTITKVEASLNSVSIYFTGKVAYSDIILKNLLSGTRQNVITIRNDSDDEAGAFTLFREPLPSLVGKFASIDIVTTGFMSHAGGPCINFSSSKCHIVALQKK